MKFSEIIALVTVFLGLAGAFQGFFAVDFFAKLIALAAGGCIVLWLTARRLTDWVRIKHPSGFAQPKRRSLRRLGTAAGALGLVCIAFSLAAWFVLWLYAINIEVTISGDRVDFLFHASRQAVNMLRVVYPKFSEFDCKPTIATHGVDTAMRDSNTPNPRLDISNFLYPQSQGMSCRQGTTIDQFRFEPVPANVEILMPARRSAYETLIISFGGVLWIASIFYVGLQSR